MTKTFGLYHVIRSILLAGLAIISWYPSSAQNEFLATVDYNNVSVQRIANIPGVTYITGNSAYDENHRRYFFQGSSTNGGPWTLYTIDAVSGTVIYSVMFSAGGANTGELNGLEYDNTSNILYGIYFINGLAQFSRIDPSTGIVTIISNIPPYHGFTESAYDQKDHLYIVSNGNSLLGIDATTGLIKNNLTGLTISNIVYDNKTGKLYGVKISPILPNPQFDSVSLATGTLHPIADLPPLTLPQLNQLYVYTIDENAGKYIFLASDPPTSLCFSDYLYVLDINTGAVLSHNIYPYAKNAGLAGYENVLSFSFDNSTGKLYALNWHPPNTPVLLTIAITASANPACKGAPVTFTATTGAQLVNPVYQWQVNGVDAGANGLTYTNENLSDGDTVRCIMINNDPCLPIVPDTSDEIVMNILNVAGPSISISSSASIICSADMVLFTASPTNAGTNPVYQWQLNGTDIGTGADTLHCTGLKDGDTVHCILGSGPPCNMPVVSNDIVTTVKTSPLLSIGDDIVVSPGKTAVLNPSVSGTIVSYQWSPSTYLDNPSIVNPVFTAGNSTAYELLVTADNGCTASGKITVFVYRDLHMPNAFTPNGDGRNDFFRIPASTVPTIQSFSIFNRWGQMVFSTSNATAAWDGSFNGQAQPTGNYVWMIEYENPFTKQQEKRKGTVVLVR